jgi:hypothetical protein
MVVDASHCLIACLHYSKAAASQCLAKGAMDSNAHDKETVLTGTGEQDMSHDVIAMIQAIIDGTSPGQAPPYAQTMGLNKVGESFRVESIVINRSRRMGVVETCFICVEDGKIYALVTGSWMLAKRNFGG